MVNLITNNTDITNINRWVNITSQGDDYLNNYARRISIETGIDKDLIYPYFVNNWYKIDNEWYFYKSNRRNFHYINELLGEAISEYFELETVNYKIAKLFINGKEISVGLLSKNFYEKDCTYKRLSELNLENCTNLDILYKIKDICIDEKNYKELLSDLKKLFIRDFFVTQLDMHDNNMLFKIKDKSIRLASLFDYENSFESNSRAVYEHLIGTLNFENKETLKILENDFEFQYLLNKLYNLDIIELMIGVKNKYKVEIPYKYMQHYIKCSKDVKKLVKEKRLV